MLNKTKCFVLVCLCLAGMVGFYMATFNDDHDAIIEKFASTTDGSYYTKHLRVDSNSAEVVVGDVDEEGGEDGNRRVISASCPAGDDVDEWIAYITASEMSETRRKIVLEGLDCKKKGVIYHQLRPYCPGNRPGNCICGCGSDLGPIWWPGFENNYDITTQAMYNIEDPFYLDCSYFVKHCFWAGGIEVAANATGELAANSEFITISMEELVPGDFVVKSGSHTILFIGNNAAGVPTWVEMSGHAEDCVLSSKPYPGGYIARRHATLVNDTLFAGGTGTITVVDEDSNSPNRDVTPGEMTKVKVQNGEGLNNPDTEFSMYAASSNRKDKLIMIDPGHGNPNLPSSADVAGWYAVRGSRWNGETEEEYALAVGLLIKNKLLAEGFDVIMAREDNVVIVPNKLRAKVASEQGADLQVCIHWNAANGNAPNVNGPMLVIPEDYDSRPWRNTCEGLWQICSQKLSAHFGSPPRGYYTLNAAVFSIDYNLPFLYLETGFCTGNNDGAKLVGDANHEAIAEAIASSIVEYYSR